MLSPTAEVQARQEKLMPVFMTGLPGHPAAQSRRRTRQTKSPGHLKDDRG